MIDLFQKAAHIFEAILKTGIDKHGCLVNLGVIYLISEQYSRAKDYFLQSIEMKPNEYKEYLRLGESYFGLKNFKLSQETFIKGLQILSKVYEKDKENVVLILEITNTKVWIAKTFKESEDTASASKILESVIKDLPDHGEALYQYSVILYESGKEKEAFQILLQALTKDNSNH